MNCTVTFTVGGVGASKFSQTNVRTFPSYFTLLQLPRCLGDSVCGFVQSNAAGLTPVPVCQCAGGEEEPAGCDMEWQESAIAQQQQQQQQQQQHHGLLKRLINLERRSTTLEVPVYGLGYLGSASEEQYKVRRR